ncbi:hypothetical protein [Amycolatopsis sp. SID8362]|uniref:LppU/SCO3897 family protein n=1 Tax=Amycolatopsis sp. SID8362 TaxID=2690346 RepID=UPI00136FD28E|nr:hypothetical protein [Amycolatopsis sp. SID8362]NBH07803.1 hypothetical protein [Amycolatopsis sp. SID8362]NED44498.1 hypothetical protein [Amycolatopsis sp. SID8362]
MTTPPSDDNPFRTPDYAAQYPPMAPVPGQPAIPHWFTVKVRITLAACVVLALALGSLAALGLNSLGGSGTPSDGDCLYLTRESGDRTAYHRVGCGSDSATYKVDRVYSGSSSCPSNGYVRFKTTTGSGSGRTLCLALNVRTGDCLRDIDDDVKVTKVSCADPAATERVQVLTGSRDRTDCEDADEIRVYTGPPIRLVCLAPAGENI